jgi:4-amino-4-deoxy-L-arabinose transferase-like glycosyltransferase
MMLSRRGITPRAECIGLVLLSLLLIGAGLGVRAPFNVDEERFLGVALEMLQSGSWLIPHRAAEIYPDKPPVFMWMVAFFTWLTHSPKVALYIPGLMSGAVSTAVLYDLGRRLWNRRVGRIAALLFLATYQTFSILQTGQIDSLLALWIAIALYGLVRHLLLGPAWGWFYLACASMALGVITKGVGFVPALMLIPYAYAVRKKWSGVVAMPGNAGKWWLGLLVMLAVIGVWLTPLLVAVFHSGSVEEVAYANNILFRQTAKRYADAWEHREAFYYFVVDVIPKYWLPMFLALPWLVPAWRRQLIKHDGRYLVLLGWVVLVLVFFSLSTGKRKIYIYPALPGLVLAAAPLVPWLLKRWFAKRQRGLKIFYGTAVVWFSLWFINGFVSPLVDGKNPHITLMDKAAEVTHGADLVLVQWREGHWLFARQPIVHFGFDHSTVEDAAEYLRDHPQAFALVPDSELKKCFDPAKSTPLTETSRADWAIVGPDADNGQCHLATKPEAFRFQWTHRYL